MRPGDCFLATTKSPKYLRAHEERDDKKAQKWGVQKIRGLTKPDPIKGVNKHDSAKEKRPLSGPKNQQYFC